MYWHLITKRDNVLDKGYLCVRRDKNIDIERKNNKRYVDEDNNVEVSQSNKKWRQSVGVTNVEMHQLSNLQKGKGLTLS